MWAIVWDADITIYLQPTFWGKLRDLPKQQYSSLVYLIKDWKGQLEALNAKIMSLALFCFVYKLNKLNFQCWVHLHWGSCLDDAVAQDILGHQRNMLLNWVGFDLNFKKLNAWICASHLLVQMVRSKLKFDSIYLIHPNSPKHHLSYSHESQLQASFPNAWSANCGKGTTFSSELLSSMCLCAWWYRDWFFFHRSSGYFWNSPQPRVSTVP